MVDAVLTTEVDRALAEHARAVDVLVPLLERIALESVAEVLPGAHEIDVHGEINDDWMPILRIQRVMDGSGDVLFDVQVGHPDPTVQDTIDKVNCEYLERVLNLTGDDYFGACTLDASTPGARVR